MFNARNVNDFRYGIANIPYYRKFKNRKTVERKIDNSDSLNTLEILENEWKFQKKVPAFNSIADYISNFFSLEPIQNGLRSLKKHENLQNMY